MASHCVEHFSRGRVGRRAWWLAWVLVSLSPAACGTAITPEQTQAIAQVQALGGKVNFKHGGYEVDLTGTPVEDQDLACLKHIAKLKNLDLQGTRITDNAIPHLQAIETLELITLQRTEITAQGVATLKKSRPNVVFDR